MQHRPIPEPLHWLQPSPNQFNAQCSPSHCGRGCHWNTRRIVYKRIWERKWISWNRRVFQIRYCHSTWCISLLHQPQISHFSKWPAIERNWNFSCDGCKSLQSIAIQDSITTIGGFAFAKCTNLKSVIFTDQSCLQEIGLYAFYRCHSLPSIIIPKSVKSVFQSQGSNICGSCLHPNNQQSYIP